MKVNVRLDKSVFSRLSVCLMMLAATRLFAASRCRNMWCICV